MQRETEASVNRIREQKRADKVKGDDIGALESEKGQRKCAEKEKDKSGKRKEQSEEGSRQSKGNGTRAARSSKQADANLMRKDEFQ